MLLFLEVGGEHEEWYDVGCLEDQWLSFFVVHFVVIYTGLS